MPLASWLFIKNGQSIWVERPHGYSIIVAGPGQAREEYDFPDEQSLDAFQITLGERLTNEGWFLWGFDRERRRKRERRLTSRVTPERRKVAALQNAR
jgi:hypothetical protein